MTPIPDLDVDDVKRFWSHIDRRGPDECWDHSAANSSSPLFWRKGEAFTSRRVLYKLVTGEDPGKMAISVTCGNHRCHNPKHMRLSIHQKAKLSKEDVQEILKSNLPNGLLAISYGVLPSAIWRVRKLNKVPACS